VSFHTTGAAPGTSWKDLTWTELPAGSPLSSMRAVVTWKGGYVAYGDKGLWASADGLAWTPSTGGLPTGGLIIAETSAGLVAFAFDSVSCPTSNTQCFQSVAGPVVAWTSINGVDWTNRGPAAGISGQQITAMIGGPTGAVVASASATKSTVWFSADGLTWKAVSVPKVSSTFPCSSAAHGSGKYVLMCPGAKETALGDLPNQPVWSTDGVNWVAGSAPATSDPSAAMDTFIVGRSGVVATGYVLGEAGPAEWWQSVDGTSWAMDAGYSPVGKYTTTNAFPGGTYPDGWLCADGTHIVALALDSSHSAMNGSGWVSWDGKSWTKLVGHGMPHAEQFAEIAFPTGVLAGGWWGAAG
jgi:hypothetical protein